MILQGNSIMNINHGTNPLVHQPVWNNPYPPCDAAGYFGGQWQDVHPQYWSKFQVWEWLQQLIDTNQLDANCIPFHDFDIAGEHLCNMTLQDFTQAAGSVGHILYNNLQNLKWSGQCGSQMPQSFNVVIKTEQTEPSSMPPWKDEGYFYDNSYDEMYESKTFCRNQHSLPSPSPYTMVYTEPDGKKAHEHPQKASTKKHSTTTSGRSWSGWMGDGWCTNLGGTPVGGRRMKSELLADTLDSKTVLFMFKKKMKTLKKELRSQCQGFFFCFKQEICTRHYGTLG
ncbi:hypothetical protein XELAEV_18021848mg [Xenopus laevis]|uniref:PNT domain-containing protein n=1 Tax=Xenopus laevis TaxID=8355 RepID=A0A974D3M1_XENLA|nr:hypothetical protein XELAEV_18021848mg [Xenopus laevis]